MIVDNWCTVRSNLYIFMKIKPQKTCAYYDRKLILALKFFKNIVTAGNF